MSASREHWKAQALKNAGERIRRLKKDGADRHVILENQRDVLRQSAKFVRELLGDDVLPVLGSEHKPTDYVAWYLSTIREVFPSSAEDAYFWTTVIDEIDRMQFGDAPEIIKHDTRQPGQNKKRALLATRRLRALEWAAFFKAEGARPMHYQRAISLSFGPDWDSIRHWRKSAEKVLGPARVERQLRYAHDGFFVERHKWHRSIMDPLRTDGDFYRLAAGIAELNEKVIDAEWEKLTSILSLHGSQRLA